MIGVPFCLRHFQMMMLGEPIPDHVYQQLGIDRVVIIRATFSRVAVEGEALGAQFVLPGFCVWCEGPVDPDEWLESTKSTRQ